MAFSREQIEKAASQLNSSNPAESQEASRILYAWQESPNSIVQVCEIMSTSTSDQVIFVACSVAEKDIVQRWLTYHPDDRSHIREVICNKALNYKGSDLSTKKLTELVVQLALKDWPSDWPEAMDNFIGSASASMDVCNLDFQIIGGVISSIYSSDTVTMLRKKQLKEAFEHLTPQLFGLIKFSLETYQFTSIAPLAFLFGSLCRLAPANLLLEAEWLSTVLTKEFEDDSKQTAETIENLFLKRPDSEQIFQSLGPQILPLLATNILSCHIPTFKSILAILEKYSPTIESWCFEDEKPDEELIEIVRLLYSHVLDRAPADEFMEEFWNLWRNILYRLLKASKSKNRFEALQPCLPLFQPMFPDIRIALFNALQSSHQDGKLLSTSVFMSWALLAEADQTGTLDFLLAQSPSPSLCYALGIVDIDLTAKDQIQLLKMALPPLLSYQSSSNDYGKSILFLLSHSIRFLNRYDQVRVAFGSCLTQFLSSNDPGVQAAAARALKYVAFRYPILFYKQPNPIFQSLFNGSWIGTMEVKSAIKVSKALAYISSSQEDEQARAFFYESTAQPICDITGSSDAQTSIKGLGIIKALSELKLKQPDALFNGFIQPLVELLQANQEEMLFAKTLDTLCFVFGQYKYEAVKIQIDQVFAISIGAEDLKDAVLSSLSALRRRFDAVEIYYDFLMEHLVNPLMATSKETDALAVLDFYISFRVRDAEVPKLIKLTTDFILDQRLDVAKRAAKLLRTIILQLAKEINFDELIENRVTMLNAIFQAMTDTFHNQIFSSLAKVLRIFFKAIVDSTFSKDKFDADVAATALKIVEVRSDLISFCQLLRANVLDQNQFDNLLREFLISYKFASSSDTGLFKRELKLDALRSELELIDAGQSSDPILQKEMEILPALKSFKIGH